MNDLSLTSSGEVYMVVVGVWKVGLPTGEVLKTSIASTALFGFPSRFRIYMSRREEEIGHE